MTIRVLSESDLEGVRALRNANRSAFFDSRFIEPGEHREWYLRLRSRGVQFFVIEKSGRAIGTISTTLGVGPTEIGNIVLDSDFRGHGIMTQAIAQVSASAGEYYCRIRPDNSQSIRAFVRAGFNPSVLELLKVVK